MRAARVLFLPVCLIILLGAAVTVPLPVFLERPGEPVSLPEHVAVPSAGAGGIDGDYLLPLVNLRRATVLRLAVGALDADTRLLMVAQVTGGVADDRYFAQQRTVFAATADLAAAIGLEAAGFPVEFGEPAGVAVAEVLPGAPAEGVLAPGDVLTAVDGEQVRTVSDLLRAIRAAEGASVQIDVLRGHEQQRVQLRPGQVPGLDQRGLGVRPRQAPLPVELPVPVEVDTGRVGGPSAGLMIALTVFDLASPDDLADGRRIAGTGTIEPGGAVGEIGGIGLKVLAADREGADVFLAPAGQSAEARAAVPEGSALQVVGVASFPDALAALQREESAEAALAAAVPGTLLHSGPVVVSTGRVTSAVPRDATP